MEQTAIREAGERIVRRLIFELTLECVALRHVPDDRGEEAVAAQPEVADGQCEGKRAGVGAYALHVVSQWGERIAIVESGPFEHTLHGPPAVYREKFADVRPQHRQLGHSEHLLRGAVHRLDTADRVECDDAVRSCFENRVESRDRLAQRLLDVHIIRDVTAVSQQTAD